MSSASCKVRIKCLEKTFEKFEANHRLLLDSPEYEGLKDQPYIKDNYFLIYEQHYMKNLANYQEYLDSQATAQSATNQPPVKQFVTLDGERLPPLSIPHFNGDFTS